jgi:NADH-quinone oxidoreductase E subunit
MSLQFSSENEAAFQRIVARYPVRRAALLPTLWLAQEQWGYLSLEVMEYVAERLDLKPAFVGSVASFYTMYYKRPMGRHHVQVCTNLSCALVGSDRILDCLRRRLGIDVGETTADGKFSLSEVECLASCGTAPMMQINDDYWENLTPERTLEIVDRLAGE